MAYNRDIEGRIDATLSSFPQAIRSRISKKKMFGGLAFLYAGKMTVGVVGDALMVRVVSPKMEATLRETHVRPMDFTRRPMKEFVFVAPDGFASEAALLKWISLGLEHARDVLNED